MTLSLPTSAQWAQRCAADGEFQLAARHFTGTLKLTIGERVLELGLADGVPDTVRRDDVIEYQGDERVWREVLAATPKRFHNDLMANLSLGLGITRLGDPVVHAQYFPAVMRAVELLRPAVTSAPVLPSESGTVGRHDAPVGRYVHLQLDGHDHRIYYEEAGQGIPVLLQHTAGCHGSQWRHLFEIPAITDHFRLIAYDLPYHGKSLPPVSKPWWSQPYNLGGALLRALPLGLASALRLDRPVFIGCSVGGLLALDLAQKHPDVFRAVVSLEGALHIGGEIEGLSALWHPQISNEYKARLMDGLMSPTSPTAYRKETSFVYASGWPPAFLGDLHYYIVEFDLRTTAHEIDTSRIGVHILSGEYDYSGTAELGRAAHEAIPGSTWTQMKGVGHFPMTENPAVFLDYLLPILDRIRR